MTHVLLVSPTAAPGGSERALVGLAKRLPEQGLTCQIVLLDHGPFERWLADARLAVDVVPMGRTRHLTQTARVINDLRRRCRAVDVVIANQSKTQVIAGIAAAAARTPCIWWQHGIPTRSRIDSTAALVPSIAVVCGSRIATEAQRRLTPRRRIELIHPGVDLDTIRAWAGSGAAIRQHYGLGDKPLVGIVARLQPWKGQELFLHAAAQIAAAHADVSFAIVGGAVLGWEGDYPHLLQKLAAELGIADRVIFPGHQDNVYPWFDALDVAVTASTGEPFGLVTVEAMALGTPVVGVQSAGTAEIIQDGASGILVAPGDPSAMAQAILTILNDDSLAHSLSRAGPIRATSYGADAMATRFAETIQRLVGGPRPSSTSDT